MKSFLYGAAIVIGSLGLFAVYLFGVALKSSGAIETDAQRWLDRELPPLLAAWNPEELIKRASPQFIEASGEAGIRDAIRAMSARLGPLKQYEGSKVLGLEAPSKSEGQPFVVVQLEAKAAFAQGGATFDVKIIRREAKWSYAAFSARD